MPLVKTTKGLRPFQAFRFGGARQGVGAVVPGIGQHERAVHVEDEPSGRLKAIERGLENVSCEDQFHGESSSLVSGWAAPPVRRLLHEVPKPDEIGIVASCGRGAAVIASTCAAGITARSSSSSSPIGARTGAAVRPASAAAARSPVRGRAAAPGSARARSRRPAGSGDRRSEHVADYLVGHVAVALGADDVEQRLGAHHLWKRRHHDRVAKLGPHPFDLLDHGRPAIEQLVLTELTLHRGDDAARDLVAQEGGVELLRLPNGSPSARASCVK